MVQGFVLPGFDPETGLLMLPWWAAAAVAALLVVLVVLAMLRGGPAIMAGSLVGIAFLGLIVTIVWVGSERVAERERADERQALVARAQALAAQAANPGSPFACLDAAVGDAVEAACERALFASPEAVAAATAYTAARLALLSDGVDYSLRANTSYEGVLPGLRRALESDRFGFVAQVLASQYGCSVENCDAFTLFRDTNRIGANLRERPYDGFVARHTASWTAPASARRVPLSSSGASPVPPGFNVPSASSIPAVSIMVPESSAPPASSTGAAPAEAAAAGSPRHPPAANPARPAKAAPPPARPAAAQAAPPPQAAAPQGAPPPPMQLVPPAPSAAPAPVGNTGSATGTQ